MKKIKETWFEFGLWSKVLVTIYFLGYFSYFYGYYYDLKNQDLSSGFWGPDLFGSIVSLAGLLVVIGLSALFFISAIYYLFKGNKIYYFYFFLFLLAVIFFSVDVVAFLRGPTI